MFKGFKQFILKGNVVDLAVGVVIGAAFSGVVNAFVKDVITPLVATIGGSHDFSSIFFMINGTKFPIGDFFNALMSFVINATVIYFFVIVPMNKLVSGANKKDKPIDPTTQKCPYCLSVISIHATRCAFCTSKLAKVTLPIEEKKKK